MAYPLVVRDDKERVALCKSPLVAITVAKMYGANANILAVQHLVYTVAEDGELPVQEAVDLLTRRWQSHVNALNAKWELRDQQTREHNEENRRTIAEWQEQGVGIEIPEGR